MPNIHSQARRATLEDIDQILSIHRKAFSGFYLDEMGPAFLRVYYECALANEGVISKGRGIGSQLLRKFVEFAWQSDANEIRLTTNRDDNDSVNQFYLKHGFHNIGVEYRNKRALNIYSLKRSDLVGKEI